MSKSWANGSYKGWRRTRARILMRDGYMCQLCGQTEGQLHVDHIIPKRLMGSESDFDIKIFVFPKWRASSVHLKRRHAKSYRYYTVLFKRNAVRSDGAFS
jgi:hypothetical protein